MLAVLGRSWDLCWRSWAAPGPLWAVLSRSWGLFARSWVALGAYVGGLGPLLEPMLAVLGRSWALCWWSWAVLRSMLAVLGHSWGLCWRSWAVLGRNVAQTLAVRPKCAPSPSGSRGRAPRSHPKHLVRLPIFSVDITCRKASEARARRWSNSSSGHSSAT